MKLRLRFIIIHTLIVSGIIALSFLLIYYLYTETRREDFKKRLWAEAYKQLILHFGITNISEDSLADLRNYLTGAAENLQVAVVDDSLRVIFTRPYVPSYTIDTALFKEINISSPYYFRNDTIESEGVFLNDYGHKAYSIASAYDKQGFARLKQLRLIMWLVAIGSIIIIGTFSFVYVMAATKPLVKLSLQMRKVTEGNLTDRFELGSDNVENNEILQLGSNFNSMLDRIEHAFELQKSFVHHASHELRTPLATMLAQTEAALRKDLTVAEAKNILRSLKEDQQELIELTNSLLLLSQYEKIHHSPDWPEIRVDEVLYDTIATVKKIFPSISISLEFARMPDSEVNISVNGNDTLLRSAFRNLIKNAFNYSDDKHVSITIGAGENEIKVDFANRGKVLGREEKERLFIPFFRGANAQKKRGFGLGLSIVKRIVTLHKGSIQYEAIDNTINCFSIVFNKDKEKTTLTV